MTKREFLDALNERLSGLPLKEREERIGFYEEMIDDRVDEGEEEEAAVAAIGSVEEIAEQIIAEVPLSKLARERIHSRRRLRVWEIVLLAVGSPIWLSLAVAALPVALLCGTAYGAFLILNSRPSLTVMIPLAAFAAGVLITGDVITALPAFLCVPPAFCLAHTLRRGVHRVRAVCHVAMATACSLAMIVAVMLFAHRGSHTIPNRSDFVISSRNALASALATGEVGAGENAGRVVREGMECALAATIFNILPGAVCALLAVFAYMADLICLTLFRTYERTKYLSRRVFVLAVSLPAAALFLVGNLLLLLIGDDAARSGLCAETVADNLYLALLPAMVLVGMLCCIRLFLLTAHRGVMLVGSILLFALSLSLAITILSLLGAGSVLWNTWRRRRRRPRAPDLPD